MNVVCLTWLQLVSHIISEHVLLSHNLEVLFWTDQSFPPWLCFCSWRKHGGHCTLTFLLTVVILIFWLAEVFRWLAAWCPLFYFDVSCVLHCTLWLCSFSGTWFTLSVCLCYTGLLSFGGFLFLLTFLFACELCTHIFSFIFFFFFSLFFWMTLPFSLETMLCSFGRFFSAWKEPGLQLHPHHPPLLHAPHHPSPLPPVPRLIYSALLLLCLLMWTFPLVFKFCSLLAYVAWL